MNTHHKQSHHKQCPTPRGGPCHCEWFARADRLEQDIMNAAANIDARTSIRHVGWSLELYVGGAAARLIAQHTAFRVALNANSPDFCYGTWHGMNVYSVGGDGWKLAVHVPGLTEYQETTP